MAKASSQRSSPALLQRDRPQSQAPKSKPNGWGESTLPAAVPKHSRRACFQQGRNRPAAARAETRTGLSPVRWQTVRHTLAFDSRETIEKTSLSSQILAVTERARSPSLRSLHLDCEDSAPFPDAGARWRADGHWLSSCLSPPAKR